VTGKKLRGESLSAAILLALLLGSPVLALQQDLPDPPDRGQFVDPFDPDDFFPYAGDIIFVPVRKPDIELGGSGFLGVIECKVAEKPVEIEEESEWGLSVTGPLTDAEMKGILEGIKDWRPPRRVTLTAKLIGEEDLNITWTHVKTLAKVIHYEIYAVRPRPAPQNEFLGVMIVEEPYFLDIKPEIEECPPDPKPKVDVRGRSFLTGIFRPFSRFFRWLFVDFPGGIGLYQFGIVRVYAGEAATGVAHLRSGESVTFAIGEGPHVVRALVRVVGIPIEWNVGPAQGPGTVTVTLATVEMLGYIVGVVLIAVIVVAVYKLGRRLFARWQAGHNGGGVGQSAPPEGGTQV
jgi:hypothetical protein